MLDTTGLREQLDEKGFLVLEAVVTTEELAPYARLYEDIMSGEVDADNHRHDLGSHVSLGNGRQENICQLPSVDALTVSQVMWPSLYLPLPVEQSILHTRVLHLARELLGQDMDFDFDMLISKEGGSLVETPWHQDESYWLDLPDKRALSFWFPMEDATTENGCMWFVPGSHKEGLRNHKPVAEGHHVKMTCELDPSHGQPHPVPAGGCTVHTGRTLHFTGGNSTNRARRAYIINCRPVDMVALERKNKYDHGKTGLDGIGTIHKKQ